jgi:hypothetical protein
MTGSIAGYGLELLPLSHFNIKFSPDFYQRCRERKARRRLENFYSLLMKLRFPKVSKIWHCPIISFHLQLAPTPAIENRPQHQGPLHAIGGYLSVIPLKLICSELQSQKPYDVSHTLGEGLETWEITGVRVSVRCLQYGATILSS